MSDYDDLSEELGDIEASAVLEDFTYEALRRDATGALLAGHSVRAINRAQTMAAAIRIEDIAVPLSESLTAIGGWHAWGAPPSEIGRQGLSRGF